MGFWNRKISDSENNYLGLDISDFSVKVFQLEKRGRFDKIRSYGSEDIRPGCIENGIIIKKEEVARAIRNAIRKARPKKINTKKAFCSISESKVFLRIISIPKVSEEEAQEAIKWEIEASIPLSVDQVYYDWQFLDQSEGKQNVLTVAVAKDVADGLIETVNLSGLMVYGIEMESIASIRSLIPRDAKKEESCLIVDMGAEKTSFIIVEGNVPYFTSSIPFSSNVITDSVADIMKVSREEAEKIKTFQGIEYYRENNSIFNSIKPFLENLSVELEKTIGFYQDTSKTQAKVNKIIVSGGGANLKGLVSYFTTRLSIEVLLGNPWVNLNLGRNLPIVNRENSVRYATAIGLAMRGKY
jgi:type IV pilus assembly protein PilM